MIYYLLTAVMVLHTVFWGTGLAWLVLPRGWRRWWWALAPGLGLALQSAVVWGMAHTSVAGTNSYALWSELLPLTLIIAAVARHGAARTGRWAGAAWGGRGILLLTVLAGFLLLWPMARRGNWTLTSSSLGSCDQADYAAGARVFQEFSRDDRTGFLGLPEVTRVGTAETFFDFWLRLNHFTPSALIAHHAALFDLQPYQLVSLNGVVLLLLNAPLVLLLGRVAAGLRGAAGLIPVALYLFSPLGAYAVHHGALGQSYGAHGIALLTLAVFGATRGRPWAWAPVVLAAFWILAGSYNFILTVALAPAGAWLLADAWRRRDWRGSARVAGMLAAMLAACAALFWGRFDGLIERFQLFEQYNFGWPVARLSPEGWLGMLRDTGLHAWPLPLRLGLSAAVALAFVAGAGVLWRRKPAQGWAVLALTLPALAGWALLLWESRVRANASYDAFKLFSVFYPGLIVGLTCWLAPAGLARTRGGRIAGLVLAGLALACAGRVGGLFAREMATPPLRVDRNLLELRRLERTPRIGSINMRIEDFWSRLWANYLLLRKPQYFSIHTYEGRLNTDFKGDWNLSDSLLRSIPLREADVIEVNTVYHAERVAAPGRVDLAFGAGWHEQEKEGPTRWRWSAGLGVIQIFNPAAEPVRAVITLRLRPLERGRLRVELGDAPVGRAINLSGAVQRVELPEISIPAGASTLILQTDQRPGRGDSGDPRELGLALYELTVQARP